MTHGGGINTFVVMERPAPSLSTLWPSWMGPFFTAVAVALGIAVALEARPVYPVWLRVALSIIPALVWAACIVGNRRRFALSGPVVFVAVALLLVHPAKFDVSPFFLVLL